METDPKREPAVGWKQSRHERPCMRSTEHTMDVYQRCAALVQLWAHITDAAAFALPLLSLLLIRLHQALCVG